MRARPLRAIAIAGALLAGWLRLRGPEVHCDVCSQRIEGDVDMCPNCGTMFDNPNREDHAVVPEDWVAGQLERVRSKTYAELQALPSPTQSFSFEADDGGFHGEVRVSFADAQTRTGHAIAVANIWAEPAHTLLATADLTREPD
jgi:hypothetical protein